MGRTDARERLICFYLVNHSSAQRVLVIGKLVRDGHGRLRRWHRLLDR